MKKRIILILIILNLIIQNTLLAKDWGLSFPKNEARPTANESVEYLKNFDSYFVGDEGKKIIYLTFDSGYENGYTEKILDILKKNKVKATFFLVGSYLKKNPEIVKRIVKEGHIVGNHTMTHPDMSKIYSKEAFNTELKAVEDIYSEITGKKMKKFYRPPEGKYNEENLKTAQELGYKTIFWSLAYRDFDIYNQPSKKEAFDKLIPRIHPGAIILLHNMSKTNVEILEELINKYKEMGYEFKNLDDL